MPRRYKIVVLLGDGISQEVVPEAVKALNAAQESISGLNLDFSEYKCGFKYYEQMGEPWPPEAYTACKESDAILYGAVGLPGARGLEHIIYMHRILRRNLDLYANVRPIKLRENIKCPLSFIKPGAIDFVIVRENTEGLYTPIGGTHTRAEVAEIAIDTKITTRKGSKRVIKYAFDLCRKRGRGAPMDGKLRVTCVDKSTVLKSCALFREVFNEVGKNYQEIEKDHSLIDAWTQWVLRRPEYYDVVVTPNIFGDIIGDMAAQIQGGLGLAPSAEVGDEHGMFRPIHGTAPDIAGKGIANPLATILSAKMLMDWLAERHDDRSVEVAAERIEKAVDLTLKEGCVTPDLGGTAKTNQVGDEIVKKILRG